MIGMGRSRIVSVCLSGSSLEGVGRVGREGDGEKMERKKRLWLVVYVSAVSGFSPPKGLAGKVRQWASCTGYRPPRCDLGGRGRNESG